MTLRLPRRRRLRSKPSSKLQTQTPPHETLPLPVPLTEFAGQYRHPGYGPINLTTIISHSSSSSCEILEGLFYPRVNPLKIQLFHHSSTAFDVRYFSPHGLGDVETGKGIVWEHETNEDGEDDAQAFFTLGLDDEVEAMGIEIEEAMVEMARKGEKGWREGMVWFEKV